MKLGFGAIAALLAAGSLAALSLAAPPRELSAGLDALAARAAFKRPDGLPAGRGAAPSQTMVDLGRTLFHDVRLSGDGTMSCATCHQPQLGFTDGMSTHHGRNGEPLVRNTPHLWNLAWSETLFWDGRAKSLEEQALGPIESRVEMVGSLADAAAQLKGDAQMVAAFAKAFPSRGVDQSGIVAALAAFERTLISPKTRFDRWLEGDEGALDADETAGFALFAGKAECSSCHSGWRFTDEAFHDIGLPDSGDLGRGTAIKLAAANNAFKTPSLRELAWTAPYMHDGSLKTLDAVIEHYAGGVTARPTLSKDMPPVLKLTEDERQQLIAFLATLSSERPPRPPEAIPKVEVARGVGAEANVVTLRVSQKDKQFSPKRVMLTAGQNLTIVNDDKRTHNVRIDDPGMVFTSNAQEPGDSVIIGFPEVGTFGVICSIHPAMRLDVQVEKQDAAAVNFR